MNIIFFAYLEFKLDNFKNIIMVSWIFVMEAIRCLLIQGLFLFE